MFRKIIKKFNNFRLTAAVTMGTGILAALYALGSFLCYNFAGDIVDGVRDVGFDSTNTGKILGMILFLIALGALIIGIIVAYCLIPAVKNTEKVTIKKGYLVVSFVGAFFVLALMVMMILLIILDEPKTLAWIIVSIPFGVISIAASVFEFILYKKCDFYMPEIAKK